MQRFLTPFGALVAAVTSCLVLAPAAAATGGSSSHPALRQELPVTAAEFADGKAAEECPGVPADKDGWHFILPGNTATFTKLTVTFEPGGEQEITVFGPPKDDHAYAVSEPGAELTAIKAEITGTVKHNKFNLSHTCPASVTPTPSGTPTDTPTDTPTGTPSDTPTDTPSGTPTDTPTGTPTDEPGSTPSATAPATTMPESPSVAPSASESTGTGTGTGSDAGTGTDKGAGTGTGDLAETGSSAPVGMMAAAAVALAGVGAFLVTRRRKAQQSAAQR